MKNTLLKGDKVERLSDKRYPSPLVMVIAYLGRTGKVLNTMDFSFERNESCKRRWYL